MWPFKKKVLIQQIDKTTVKSVICIPGHWSNVTELFGESAGRLMAVGNLLMDIAGKKAYEFELCEYDERMRKSFQVAGKVTSVTDDFLNEIDKHRSVIYITGETGDFEKAWDLANLAAVIINSGGIGVKVESTGKAFEKESWITQVSEDDVAGMYELYVLDSLHSEDGSVYSCGMHNIGYEDVVVYGQDFSYGYQVARGFNYMRIIDKPVIKHGETFRLQIDAPRFVIEAVQDWLYPKADLFYNPFGMWRLTEIK